MASGSAPALSFSAAKTRHTPGPWVVDSLGVVTAHHGNVGPVSICETKQVVWANAQWRASKLPASEARDKTTDWCRDAFWEAQANGVLIAAAPELLEACKASRAIVTQHNLLSTATDAERRETIDRLIDWLNGPCLAALRKAGAL